MTFDELLEILDHGGATMAVIVLFSVAALGVAFERAFALWGVRSGARALAEVVSRHLLRGELAAARAAADRSRTPAAELFRVGFERLARGGPASAAGAVERERQQLLLSLRRGLWMLATIGATTPFIGLFGTVAGIMRSFRDLGVDVAAGGTGGSAAVMTGISEALVATAAGIVVAVEAVVLFNVFQATLSRAGLELRLTAEAFVELLGESAQESSALARRPEPSSVPARERGASDGAAEPAPLHDVTPAGGVAPLGERG